MNLLPVVATLALLQGIAQVDQRPLALSEVHDSASSLFDSARDSAWTQAEEHLRELQRGVANLANDIGPTDSVASVRGRVAQLVETVPRRDRVKTMDAANAITQYAIGLADGLQSRVPAQIPRLAYLGRQIELSVAANDPDRFSNAVADIRQTWDELEPQLEGRGHVADVRRMTDIVATLEATTKLSDAEALARQERDVVTHLVSAF